jgi:acyl-CoA synthetase (AMP-forming)/AMP-acid ligase II
MQVSPTEIEGVLLEQPDALIVDCAVAGVSGGRTSDEKIPRAWVILSPEGAERGKQNVISALSKWVEERLSKYKHLRYAPSHPRYGIAS